VKLQKAATAIRYVIGIFLITFLVIKVDISNALELLRLENWRETLVGVLSLLFSLSVLQGARVHYILGKYTSTFRNTLNFILVSSFLGTFVPGSVGPDIIRVIYFKKCSGSDWKRSIYFMSIDRLAGFFFLFVVAVFGGVIMFFIDPEKANSFPPELLAKAGGIIVGVMLLIIIVLAVSYRIFVKKGTALYNQIVEVKLASLFKFLSVLMALIVLFHAFRSISVSCLLSALDVNVRLYQVLFCLALTEFISALPISVSALGVREGMLAFSLSLFSVPLEVGLSVAIVFRLFSMITVLWGGLTYLFNKKSFDFNKDTADINQMTAM